MYLILNIVTGNYLNVNGNFDEPQTFEMYRRFNDYDNALLAFCICAAFDNNPHEFEIVKYDR